MVDVDFHYHMCQGFFTKKKTHLHCKRWCQISPRPPVPIQLGYLVHFAGLQCRKSEGHNAGWVRKDKNPFRQRPVCVYSAGTAHMHSAHLWQLSWPRGQGGGGVLRTRTEETSPPWDNPSQYDPIPNVGQLTGTQPQPLSR